MVGFSSLAMILMSMALSLHLGEVGAEWDPIDIIFELADDFQSQRMINGMTESEILRIFLSIYFMILILLMTLISNITTNLACGAKIFSSMAPKHINFG